MKFLPWPEIEGFHNIRKFIRVDPNEWFRAKEQLNGTSTVTYKAKVKLHGTNAAVRIDMDGNVTAQSRTNIITPENDNAGFARWVKSNEEEWKKTAHVPSMWEDKPKRYLNMVFFGEWIGPGIQKGVAVSEIPKKSFAIFAMKVLGKDDEENFFEVDPKRIEMYLGKSGIKFAASEEANLPDVYVLPWYREELKMQYMHQEVKPQEDIQIDINWKQSDEELTKAIAPINDWVMAIEANDPWVEATFGVKGTGEGLVFYPCSKEHRDFEFFQNLVFKAKGEKHKNIATAKPAQVNAEAAASIDSFVELVLTQARLEQGVSAASGNNFDMKLTGKFVAWVSADVEKETQDELAASGLTFKQVQKAVTDKARAWYLTQAKK